MVYIQPNLKSKKAIKDALAEGKVLTVYDPGFGTAPENGTVAIEGPHYPEPHKWWATATLQNGRVVKIK